MFDGANLTTAFGELEGGGWSGELLTTTANFEEVPRHFIGSTGSNPCLQRAL
jgi:hypothetical protein